MKLSQLSVTIAAILVASGLAISPLAEAQQYWNTNGTSATISAANWGAAPGGPFTNAFVANADSVFGANSLVTGATVNVGNVTVGSGFTVTFTAGGTLGTGGNIRTLDVGTGATLNLGGQALSTAAGTGFIKNGAGVLSLNGSAFAGGFTLNAGTVAVGGVNAMGNGGALTINGGTIRSTSTTARDLSGRYAGGITIGGDFTLGDTTNSGLITFSNLMNLGASTRTITANSNGTFTSDISGSGGLTKAGSATLFLAGTNGYSGGTTINAGVVRFDRIASMPASGNVAVNNGGTLQIDVGGAGEWTNGTSGAGTVGGLLAGVGGAGSSTVTYSGNVTLGLNNGTDFSYAGNIGNVGTSLALRKDGTGVLALLGSNTFTGSVTLNGGTIRAGSGAALGNNSTFVGNNTASATTLASNDGNSITFNKSVSTNLGGGGITFGDAIGTGNLTFTGNLTRALGATDRTVNVFGSTVATFNGNLLSPGTPTATTTFFKSGTGTLAILGTGNATDFGFSNVVVTGGTLAVSRLANLGSASSLGTATNATPGAVSIVLDGGALNYVDGGNAASSTNRLLQIGRTTAGAVGTIRNNATNASETVTFSNTGAIAYGTVDQARSLVLGGTNTGANTLSSIIGNNGTGVVSLTKQDGGRWVLNAANTYTGSTTVAAGTLIVNGSTASASAVTINSSGVLGGSGAVGGSITVDSGGTLAPGSSIESLASGSVTLNGGSVFAYELDNDAAPLAAGDLLAITGDLTLSTNTSNQADITFTELGAGSWAAGEKLTLISYSGTWNGGLFDFLGNSVADDSVVTINGLNWTFNYNDAFAGSNFTADLTGSSFVTITAVPEPTALLMAGMAIMGCAIRRRR